MIAESLFFAVGHGDPTLQSLLRCLVKTADFLREDDILPYDPLSLAMLDSSPIGRAKGTAHQSRYPGGEPSALTHAKNLPIRDAYHKAV